MIRSRFPGIMQKKGGFRPLSLVGSATDVTG